MLVFFHLWIRYTKGDFNVPDTIPEEIKAFVPT